MVDGRWGDALREARVRAGLTQDEVAHRAGVSVRTVRHIERGHVEPRKDTLTRLCRVLGYDPAAVAGDSSASRLPYEIRLLGPLAVLRAGVAVAMPLKQRVLLGLLAVQPDRIVSHDEIADALWSGDAPQGYQHLVYTYVARLRRIVTPGDGHWISTVRGGYVLSSRAMPLDLRRFEDDAARAGSLAAADPAGALDAYGRALRRWQGRLLEDLPALWQHPAVVRVALRHIDVAIDFADLAISLGQPARVIEPLTIASHGDPLHEALQARIMLGLAGSGRRAAALRLYDDLRVRLRAELGVEPGEELAYARETVLAGQRSAEGSHPPDRGGGDAATLRRDSIPCRHTDPAICAPHALRRITAPVRAIGQDADADRADAAAPDSAAAQGVGVDTVSVGRVLRDPTAVRALDGIPAQGVGGDPARLGAAHSHSVPGEGVYGDPARDRAVRAVNADPPSDPHGNL
ncbi:BTAD domain-containing putative transcriptional regulator [Streptomyces sp. NPDC006458]|uniref:BTAD domain-containing putative transcriptional regulator n=1 Tax=Streptomyces sp. NPDC006458 TaxID=3154302 RepID=UPI0033B223F7